MPTERKPDAPELNARDDFHLLWAARKALELLCPGAELKALGIEGPAREDAAKVDPTGEVLLGIDVTEYYGADTFAAASLVVFSQLKYSTRRSDTRWTAARLADGKAGKGRIAVHVAAITRPTLTAASIIRAN